MAQKLMKGNKEAGEGLYKLYKSKPEVVQKMGYTMQLGKNKSGIDSSHTFPMGQAYTMQMAPLLQTKEEEGMPQDIDSKTIAMPSGALATQTDVTSTFEIPGTTSTVTPESQGSYSKVFSGFEKNEKGQSINPINKNVYDNLQQFIDDAEKIQPSPLLQQLRLQQELKLKQQLILK